MFLHIVIFVLFSKRFYFYIQHLKDDMPTTPKANARTDTLTLGRL